MPLHYPHLDSLVNHIWIVAPVFLPETGGPPLKADKRSLEMAHEIDTSATLWANVLSLMHEHYKEENLSRLASECGFAQSTATRIKQGKISPGLDKLDLIARRFGLSTWQLLVPGMDPKNLPTLQPVSKQERALYDKIMSATREIIAAEPYSQEAPATKP